MFNPTPTVTTDVAGDGAILAAALTDPQFVPVTRLWAGDKGQVAAVPEGAIVGEITSGPDAGKVGAYDPAATDGRETAIGVLHCGLGIGVLFATDNNGNQVGVDVPVSVFVRGAFVAANLTGLDPAAETQLGGATDSAGVFRY